MNLCQWKPKKHVTPAEDFFGFDHPFFGLSLFPELKQLSSPDSGAWYPAIDVTEQKENYLIKVDLPGIKKEDIELSAEGSILTIKGERKYDNETKDKNVHRIERSYGQFVRRLDLDQNIDLAKVKAKYTDGVLQINITKDKAAEPKQIQIDS